MAPRLDPLWDYARSNTGLGSFRDVHPTVAVTSIFVVGFAFVFLIAGIASPSFRHSIPETPLISSVTDVVDDALPLVGDDSSDSDDESDDDSDPPAEQPDSAVPTIPAATMTLYEAAAHTCNMPWEVLAGVGRIETNHGQSNAPGVHSGTNFAGAAGPMQFMAGTWSAYGVDGDGDGVKDIYNQSDSVYSAANYLCANGARDSADLHNALIHYNHDESYVDSVMSAADDYKNAAYAMPVSAADAAKVNFDRPHHDYSADDIAMPVGTQIYAVRGGTAHVALDNGACGNTLIIDGTDGNRYTYCHASSVDVSDGATVDTGQPVLKSGGAAGAEGAGDSTGPHLHLQITVGGTNVCPQPLIDDWRNGTFSTPSSAPTSGCSY